MKSEPVRQNAIVEYMVAKDPTRSYGTRELAGALGCTTNAILAAFKRLRANGRAFQVNNHWYLSSAEQINHRSDTTERTHATSSHIPGT